MKLLLSLDIWLSSLSQLLLELAAVLAAALAFSKVYLASVEIPGANFWSLQPQ